MSANNQDEMITIDVIFKARVDDSEVKTKKTTETTEQEDASALLSFEDTEAAKKRQEAFENFETFIGTLDQQGLKNLSAIATNPAAKVETELLGILGKAGVYGAVAAGIIALILESPDVIIKVVQALGQKGGPLNQDYERKLDQERQLGLDRDIQFRRAAGFDIVITNQDTDYILSDPGFVANSLVDIETTRAIRINSNETQYGYAGGP